MKKSQKPMHSAAENRVREVIAAYRDTGENTDVLGMYTGVAHLSDTAAPTNAIDGGKVYHKPDTHPEQDADDL